MSAWPSKATVLLAGPALLVSEYFALGSFGLQPFAHADAASVVNPHDDMHAQCTQHMKDMEHMHEMMRHMMPPGMMGR